MKKIAAIYARVSSLKQKEGETINSQISALVDFAAKQNYIIPDGWIYKDEGYSGSVLKRPALDELREQIHEEEIDFVLVYSPDRLSRKYAYQLLLEVEFQKKGTQIIFYNTPKAESAEDQLSLHFKAIFAEYERAQIIERCRRGRLHRAKQGNISVLHTAPYGYVYNKKSESKQASYIIEEERAKIVRKIFSLYALEQMSIANIVRELCKDGIISPGGNEKWHLSTVRDILRNPAYTGTTYFGKTEKSEGVSEKIFRTKKGKIVAPQKHRQTRSRDMWIPISIPCIIEEKTFQMAQERLDKNKQLASRNTKEPSPLQGLLVCGFCGSPYYKKVRGVQSNGKKITYYCCSNRLKSGSCKNQSYRQERVDTVIWEHITELLRNPHLIEEEIERRMKNMPKETKIQSRSQELEKELVRLKKASDKLLDAFQEGECLTIDELKSRMKAINQQKKTLERDLESLQAQSFQKQQKEAFRSSVGYFQGYLSKSTSINIKEKQKILRLLIDKVVLGDEIEIHHCIPLHESSPLQPDRIIKA